jgi:transcriptional regulator with XRE-family HTH domain
LVVAIETTELGRQLRARRVSAGKTVATVAADAGLSMPYVANLENGRGNPTVATLQAWAGALAMRLDIKLNAASDHTGEGPSADLPASLRRFSRTQRFRRDTETLAGTEDVVTYREDVLQAMTAIAATCRHELTDLDWNRTLDLIVLLHHTAHSTP